MLHDHVPLIFRITMKENRLLAKMDKSIVESRIFDPMVVIILKSSMIKNSIHPAAINDWIILFLEYG